LKTRIENTYFNAKERFEEKKDLIAYLEGLFPNGQVVEGYKLLSQDANHFKELY
jgi:hypothetical protein